MYAQTPIRRSVSSEAVAAIAGAAGSAVLLAKKLLSPKGAKPDHVSRAEFYAEMLATRERINALHVAMLEKGDAMQLTLLEKLDTNHRELLEALERQAGRINLLEAGLARMDERTRTTANPH